MRDTATRRGRAVGTVGNVGAKGSEIPQGRSSQCERRAPGKQCRKNCAGATTKEQRQYLIGRVEWHDHTLRLWIERIEEDRASSMGE